MITTFDQALEYYSKLKETEARLESVEELLVRLESYEQSIDYFTQQLARESQYFIDTMQALDAYTEEDEHDE